MRRINEGLKARGLVTWFDSDPDRMEDDILDKMTAGIDGSVTIAVFVTKNCASARALVPS